MPTTNTQLRNQLCPHAGRWEVTPLTIGTASAGNTARVRRPPGGPSPPDALRRLGWRLRGRRIGLRSTGYRPARSISPTRSYHIEWAASDIATRPDEFRAARALPGGPRRQQDRDPHRHPDFVGTTLSALVSEPGGRIERCRGFTNTITSGAARPARTHPRPGFIRAPDLNSSACTAGPYVLNGTYVEATRFRDWRP
jgi:hypothetical protein